MLLWWQSETTVKMGLPQQVRWRELAPVAAAVAAAVAVAVVRVER